MNERKIIEDLLTTMKLAARRANPLMRARMRRAITDAEAAMTSDEPSKRSTKKRPADPDPDAND